MEAPLGSHPRERDGGSSEERSKQLGHDMAAARLLHVEGLTVDFPSAQGTLRAVGDVSLHLDRGEILGLVGESGSGKSMTALSLLRLVPAPGRITRGSIVYGGRELLSIGPEEMRLLRGRKIAWISQTPRASLNPSMRVGEQIMAALRSFHPGLHSSAVHSRLNDLLGSLGFPDPGMTAARFPHELSGGMCQRVGIALALAGDPELLIADEPTTALDAAVQIGILALLRQLNREKRLSIVIITHDLAIVRAVCQRVVVLYGGEVQETGTVEGVFGLPGHPYTRALLESVPNPDKKPHRLTQLQGQPVSAQAGAPGCRFASRCPEAAARCHSDRPILHRGAVRCHLAEAPGGLAA